MKYLYLTADLMNSADYKDRFKAEYYQLKIRAARLDNMIIKYEAGTLNFQPVCDILLLKRQHESMTNYLHILSIRAEIEGITL